MQAAGKRGDSAPSAGFGIPDIDFLGNPFWSEPSQQINFIANKRGRGLCPFDRSGW